MEVMRVEVEDVMGMEEVVEEVDVISVDEVDASVGGAAQVSVRSPASLNLSPPLPANTSNFEVFSWDASPVYEPENSV